MEKAKYFITEKEKLLGHKIQHQKNKKTKSINLHILERTQEITLQEELMLRPNRDKECSCHVETIMSPIGRIAKIKNIKQSSSYNNIIFSKGHACSKQLKKLKTTSNNGLHMLNS